MNLGRRLGPAAAIGLVVVLLASREGVARAGDDEKQARTLYERAEKSFDLGKFAEALADYQAAYEAKPLPGFLFNIAQCYRNMGNFERARFFFRRYLTLEPHAPNHRRVEELISEMSRQLDAQTAAAATNSPPATAPPPTAAPPLPMAAARSLPVPSPGPPPAEAPPAAPVVVPSPSPPPPPSAAPAVESAAPSVPLLTETAPPPEPSHRPIWKRWWFWTGVGAVVAGGVVAAILLSRPQTVTPGTLEPIDGR
jgi:hypothetical protein